MARGGVGPEHRAPVGTGVVPRPGRKCGLGLVEVVHLWDPEGFPVGAWGHSSATGGLERQRPGGQLLRGTSGGSGLGGSALADAGCGAPSGFVSGLGCALGAWPWQDLKLSQPGLLFLETKARGMQ